MFKARPAILNALAVFYGFVSFILILLVLISGSKSSILPDFYFLRTDASNLNVPSALSDASLLRDISSVSGVDLVGSDATARSLGLADSYTVALLSSCGRYPGDQVRCTDPEVGYAFDPEDDLRLSSTNILGGTNGIFSYHNVSSFMAGAYILSAILVMLAPIPAFVAGRFPRAATIGAALSCIATIFLAAASIAAVVVFPKAKDSFNAALSGAGIQTTVGTRLFVLSWIATVFALLSAITLVARARAAKHNTLSRAKINNRFPEHHGGEYKSTRALLSGQETAKFSKLSSSAPGSDDGMEMDPIQPRWRGEPANGEGRSKSNKFAYEPYSHHDAA